MTEVCGVGAEIVAVVVEEDVLNVLVEGGFAAHVRCRLVAGAVGATGTRTVTRTLASVVPPSPFAVRWKLVELEGETVWVPLRLTSPMPSMVTAVAFWLRQLRTTDWPRSIASGSAVMVAVGAAAVRRAQGRERWD